MKKSAHNGETLILLWYYERMGNTVGSMNTDFWDFKTKDDAYILGLWCADGYHWGK
jgi:hypothetical protein